MSKNDPKKPPRGMTRNPDHATSEKAAVKVKRRTIRALVLSLAEDWPEAFTDEEMDAKCRKAEPDKNRAESSYRKRRTELTDDNIIVDTGTERPKKNGESAKVWVHRKFHPAPPPERVKPKGRAAQALARRKREALMFNALVAAAYYVRLLPEPVRQEIAEALGLDYPIRVTDIPAKRPL